MRRLLLLCVPVVASAESLSPDARGTVAPDRHFDVEKLRLDLALDPAARSIGGTATFTVRRLSPGPLILDQVALDITEVSSPWHVDGDTLVVDPGDATTLTVRYSAHPRTGLHFRGSPPDRYAEVWSQGEADDNRHWFPGWDHPNDRFVYEGHITAPEGWKVLTNSGMDVVNYLIMLAAGPYEVHGDEKNSVWVPPGTAEASWRRVLDPVPGMMAHMGERTGVPYPWGTYRQVFVQRFLFTGMENTSATIEASWMAGAPAIDGTRRRNIESVVAHELAHQWYGDWLTCHTWRELWLNEGFATFFAADWEASHRGPADGAIGVRRRYLASLATESLAGRFHQPGKGPSHNVYNKGASVLHMLRVMLGEDTFWAGIRRYTQRPAPTLVESDELRRSMEDVSGQELGWFFQQWVELPDVPELTVTSRYEDGVVVVKVTQKGRYTLPIAIEVGTAEGPVRASGWLTDESTELRIPSTAAPMWVAFDPDGGLLAKVEQKQKASRWEAQLASTSMYARVVAIEKLGETSSSGALVALLGDGDEPVELRRAAAEALGKQRATDALLPFAALPDDELRLEVTQALGGGVDTRAVSALRARLSDPNPDIRGAAITALARLDVAEGLKAARKGVVASRPEDDRMVEAAAGVIGEHGAPGDLPLLARVAGPMRSRSHADRAAVRIVSRMPEGAAREAAGAAVSRRLVGLLADLDLRTRQAAVASLGEVGDARAVEALELYRRGETDEMAKAASESIAAIRGRKATPDETPNAMEAKVKALEERLDKVEEEMKEGEERH